MNKNTRQKINTLTLIWLIILIIPVTWLIMPVKKSLKPNYRPKLIKEYEELSDKTSLTKQDILSKAHIPTSQLYIINKENGRNPFSTGKYALRTAGVRLKEDISYIHTAKKETQGFVLNGLTYSDENKIAIINNKIVKEGDFINNSKLIKIQEDSVILKNEESTFTLTLKEHTPK